MMISRYFGILFVIFLLAPLVRANEVVARLRPAVVLPGQRAMLEIEAPEGALERLPDMPQIPGLGITPQRPNRIRRGNQTMIVAYNVVQPQTTGIIPIPAITVPLAGGRTTTTQPMQLTVVDAAEAGPAPAPNKRLHCILLTPRNTYFTGEQFPIHVLVLVDPQVNLQNLEQPKLPREGFAIDRFENPLRGELAFAGRRWVTFSYTARATALASGEMRMGPLEAKATIGIPEEGGNGFFQRYRDYPLTATAEAKVLTVKPFPPNPPDGFEGAVGKFTLEAAFDPPPSRADDPVAVKLTVRGTGDATQISIPRLADESGWEFFEGTRTEAPLDTSDLRAEVTFRRILRPKVTPGPNLPPFRLVFLNPVTGEYETAQSNALALPVSPTAPTAPPASPPIPVAGIDPALANPSPLPSPAALNPQELLLSFPADPMPRWAGHGNRAWLAGWGLHALALAVLLALGGKAWWERYSATEAGQRAACRRAMRAKLNQAERVADAQSRLLGMMRWFEEWQRSTLARPLRADEESSVAALRSALNASRYSTHAQSAPQIPAKALSSLLDSRP